MLGQLKSIFALMGQGLAHQNLGELSSTADKIRQMENQSNHYRLAGGQSRIVLIASTDTTGPAFDFVVEFAEKTNSLIEILYVKPEGEISTHLMGLLNKLSELSLDFQITFAARDLRKTVSDYSKQRLDIMAVVCSASESLLGELRSPPPAFDSVIEMSLPKIMVIGDNIPA